MDGMETKAAEPWWVPEQRAHKAARLASALHAIGAKADDAAHFTDADWREAEALAEVRRASVRTRRLATEMLAGSSNPQALCPFCGLGDPEGVPGPRKPFGHPPPCSR